MKKVVKYIRSYFPINLGASAYIELAEDHYNPNVETRQVTTSNVVKIEANGNFETLNTHYHKVGE